MTNRVISKARFAVLLALREGGTLRAGDDGVGWTVTRAPYAATKYTGPVDDADVEAFKDRGFVDFRAVDGDGRITAAGSEYVDKRRGVKATRAGGVK